MTTKPEKLIKDALLAGAFSDKLAALLTAAERREPAPELREQVAALQTDEAAADAYAHRMAVEAAMAGRSGDPVAFVRDALELMTKAAAGTPKARIRFSLRPRTPGEIVASRDALEELGSTN